MLWEQKGQNSDWYYDFTDTIQNKHVSQSIKGNTSTYQL